MEAQARPGNVEVPNNAWTRRDFLKGVAAIGLGAAGGLSILPHGASALETPDALTRYTRSSLKSYTDWLARNRAKGIVGEVNWPNDLQRDFGDEAAWNALGDKWYSWAKAAGLWTTMHCVDETQLWGGFWLTSYVSAGDKETRPVSAQASQARVYERYASSGTARGVFRKGMQVAGSAKWKGTYTNTNPGVYDEDYWYASQQTMDYLKSKGTDIIRLPFRWERLQPRLGGRLNQTELQRLKAGVNRAGRAGIKVTLCLFNSAGYFVARKGSPYKLKLGTPDLPQARFYDVWRRLSYHFENDSTVTAYDLMNEPDAMGGMGSGGFGSEARAWEAYSQRCLRAIRDRGDRKLIVVGGMSGTRKWALSHPKGWIKDPANNHLYDAHHYFDTYRGPDTGGGHYRNSYQNENAYLARQGY